MKKGNQILFGIQGVSVDVDWKVPVAQRLMRDVPNDLSLGLPGSPSFQEVAPSLKRGFLEERKVS